MNKLSKFISGGLEEEHPNENIHTFHMKHQLIPVNNWYNSRHCDDLSILKPSIRPTLEAILSIKGITEVSISTYDFTITKATAYSWNELRPQIILAMSKYLPAKY